MIGGKGKLGAPGPAGPQGPAGTNGAAGAVGPQGPTGPIIGSHVIASLGVWNVTHASGTWTVGHGITVLAGGCTVAGFEANWKYSGAGTDTVTFFIWNSGGTLVASVTTTFTSTGYKRFALASPVALTAGTYTVAACQSGGGYCQSSSSPAFAINYGGNWTITANGKLLINQANTRPTSEVGANTEVYCWMGIYVS